MLSYSDTGWRVEGTEGEWGRATMVSPRGAAFLYIISMSGGKGSNDISGGDARALAPILIALTLG